MGPVGAGGCTPLLGCFRCSPSLLTSFSRALAQRGNGGGESGDFCDVTANPQQVDGRSVSVAASHAALASSPWAPTWRGPTPSLSVRASHAARLTSDLAHNLLLSPIMAS